MNHSQFHWPAPLGEFLTRYPELVPSHASDCPVGWAVIVRDALARILDLSRSSSRRITVSQIKQRFGGLRIYFVVDEPAAGGPQVESHAPSPSPTSASRLARAIVDDACRLASVTCEVCGAPGRRTNLDGYLVTACEAHAVRREP